MWVNRDLWFIAPGVALLLSPVVTRWGWERWWVRCHVVPAAAMLALLGLIGWQLITCR